jgi:ribonuclease G
MTVATKKIMHRPPRREDLSAIEPDRSNVRSDWAANVADQVADNVADHVADHVADRGVETAVQVKPLAENLAPEELLISATSFETRLAVVADGLLQELHVTPTGNDSQVGTIALGKIMRVLPGMQAAFVELGLARPGFLHARDIERPLVAEDGSMVDARDIRKLVHEGQVLPVQVVKDPIASKGARLTTNLALPSRFLVLTPDSAHIGVSQRISDADERDRLREVVTQCSIELGLPHDHGFIVRTAGEGATYQEFMSDMQALLGLWRSLEAKRVVAKTGDALFSDLPNHIRMLRDLVGPQTRLICVDEAVAYEAVIDFCKTTLPDYQHSIKKAKESQPLFERYGLEGQIRGALKPRVSLPSGGYLIVEQTEAMVTVDVNTGGFTGTHSLEDTVFQTNLEAAQALPRQLRLRNYVNFAQGARTMRRVFGSPMCRSLDWSSSPASARAKASPDRCANLANGVRVAG